MDKDLEIILEELEKLETTGMIYEYPRDDKGILYLRFIPEIEIEQKSVWSKLYIPFRYITIYGWK